MAKIEAEQKGLDAVSASKNVPFRFVPEDSPELDASTSGEGGPEGEEWEEEEDEEEGEVCKKEKRTEKSEQ